MSCPIVQPSTSIRGTVESGAELEERSRRILEPGQRQVRRLGAVGCAVEAEPDGPHPGTAGSRHVVAIRVADVDAAVRRCTERPQRAVEDLGSTLVVAGTRRRGDDREGISHAEALQGPLEKGMKNGIRDYAERDAAAGKYSDRLDRARRRFRARQRLLHQVLDARLDRLRVGPQSEL